MSLIAQLETNHGSMTIELYEEQVPNTVKSFSHLIQKGFYDGLCFHRIIEGFMIQGGCPDGSGRSGPGYQFEDEFVEDLRHEGIGVLSMANAGPNTNGSQFFVTLAATPHLNDRHSVFGRVTQGIEVLEEIGSVETDMYDRPLDPVTIEKVLLLRDGEVITEELEAPETIG
tara:strand:+ start:315 stop:827 length:513 start_codon:yes stop_codon:yes gene_type:complete